MATDNSVTVVKHEKYFLDTIIFSVQNTLYKVPRYHFQTNSEAFSVCFSLPQGNDLKEGDSEDHPLKLEGIEKVDFERLLEVLYPLDVIPCHTQAKEDSTYQPRWISVLKLSTNYGMAAPRRLAIERLKDVVKNDPVDQVTLARTYAIPEWFEEGTRELITRSSSISSEDAERLNYRTAFFIYRCREAHRAVGSRYRQYEGLFQEYFKNEIQGLESSCSEYDPSCQTMQGVVLSYLSSGSATAGSDGFPSRAK